MQQYPGRGRANRPPRLFPQDKRQKGDHAMETIILGSTGIAATRSGFGALPIQRLSKEEAARLLTDELFRERSSALIMSDIDHFKRINDSFGHQCGDEVLRRVSGLYRAGLRQEDIVCRYGGEEFLILAPGISAGVARGIAQRLGDAVREMRIVWEGSPVAVTASFGVCALPPLGQDGFTLRFLREHVQIADLNLYRAKHGGRDQVVGGDCDDADAGAECCGPEN